MKTEETHSILKHGWFHVANTYYRRYPNPHSTHVLTEDVVSRKLDGHILKTVRLYKKANQAPYWLLQLLPTPAAYILEESHVDPVEKTIVTYSKNITLTTFLEVREKMVIGEHGLNRDWSAVHRSACITSSFFGLGSTFEAFGLKRYRSNINRMDVGFDGVLSNRTSEDGDDSVDLTFSSYTPPLNYAV